MKLEPYCELHTGSSCRIIPGVIMVMQSLERARHTIVPGSRKRRFSLLSVTVGTFGTLFIYFINIYFRYKIRGVRFRRDRK